MKTIIISILAILLISYYAAANVYAVEENKPHESKTTDTNTHTDNPSNTGKPDVSPKPGETNDKNIPEAQPSNPTEPTVTTPSIITGTEIKPTTNPIETGPVQSHPDKGCAFNPDSPKCHPDKDGKCPPGFGHNVHGNCFPSGKCPSGFSRHDNDETGKCFRDHNEHRTIVIEKHTSSSSSNNHNLSDKCFGEIKTAWLAKISRGENSKVDSIIDNCLNIH